MTLDTHALARSALPTQRSVPHSDRDAAMTRAGVAEPLTVLVVDDEPLARQRLRRLLGADTGVEIVGECANGEDAVRVIAEAHPDVVLLDIRMPKLDGLAVLRSLPADQAPAIIFVTAFDAHATAAFEAEALDYVMKPVEPERLRLAIQRARRRRDRNEIVARHDKLVRFFERELGATATVADAHETPAAPVSTPAGRAARLRRILVKERERRFFVNVEDIDWLEAYGNYVRLHIAKRVHLIRGTMAQLEASLDDEQFARIHRSSIVNLSRVREVQPWFSGDYVALLHDGTRLKMGRAYRPQFERRGIV